MNPIDGIHHITLITGDAPANVDFYVRVLGLRLVKKTVNQDDPGVYHLFFAIVHRVGSEAALDFWADRLADAGVSTDRREGRLGFADPEGMRHELGVFQRPDRPLSARSREVPERFALQGFEGVRAAVADPLRSEELLQSALGFAGLPDHVWEARGAQRGGQIQFETATEPGVPGAGTVHHIAWSVPREELEGWRAQLIEAGGRPTPVIDRFYFQSVYFRDPGGILYELATLDGAGFDVDEPAATMGEHLALPPEFEVMRSRIEPALTPLPDIRQWRPVSAPATT